MRFLFAMFFLGDPDRSLPPLEPVPQNADLLDLELVVRALF